jgi:hypothetical protein
MAGLLHDVGHGPFGHFFDEHFLSAYGLTHETLGGHIIRQELGELLGRVRRNPNSQLEPHERLNPEEIVVLITRPRGAADSSLPRWLVLLRSLFSGIYTVDNMDFVLRDAYMSGYSGRAFDLERLLHYSFFSPQGLTVHHRGLAALVQFISVRADLFRAVYFHRTVRAIDLALGDLFAESKEHLFPGNPLEHLDAYLHFTDWSLLVDVAGWTRQTDPRRRELGEKWQRFLNREIPWKMVCQRNLVFGAEDAERASIFSKPEFAEAAVRSLLPEELNKLPLRIDLARHAQRPGMQGASAGQNFLFDPARNEMRSLTDDQLFRQLPVSHRICRIYARSDAHAERLAAALDTLVGSGGVDDLTNV